MKKEAEITGERWDYSAEGYSDIIRQEFLEVGDIWERLLADHAPETGKKLWISGPDRASSPWCWP